VLDIYAYIEGIRKDVLKGCQGNVSATCDLIGVDKICPADALIEHPKADSENAAKTTHSLTYGVGADVYDALQKRRARGAYDLGRDGVESADVGTLVDRLPDRNDSGIPRLDHPEGVDPRNERLEGRVSKRAFRK